MTSTNPNQPIKKKGGYNFGSSATSIQAIEAAKKSAKTASLKNAATAKKIANKTAGAAKNNFDLGLASIAKSSSNIARSTSNATRQTANTVTDSVERGSKALRGAFANAASNAKQIQDKVSTLGREVTNNLTQTANKAAKSANTSLELQRQNAEAIAQSLTTASQALREAGEELFSYANTTFTNNVESARKVLECRNVAEYFELQSKILRQNMESAFEQGLRISELAIQTATEALEPVNEAIARSSKKLAGLASQ